MLYPSFTDNNILRKIAEICICLVKPQVSLLSFNIHLSSITQSICIPLNIVNDENIRRGLVSIDEPINRNGIKQCN